MDYEELAESVFGDFSGLLNFDRQGGKHYGCGYGMEKRLILASRLAEDGKNRVLELASGRGMATFAMQKYGIDTVSTEIDGPMCKNELGKVNPGRVVRCNGFHLPFKENSFDAIVSYHFLGEGYMIGELAKGRALKNVFEEFSHAADTIYCVDLGANYSNWFAPITELQNGFFEPNELKTKFEGALGKDWTVEYIGQFGVWMPDKDETGKSRIYDRVGFKFTKKGEATGKRI